MWKRITLTSETKVSQKITGNGSDVQSYAQERKHLHILNGPSGTIDSKREWRIHTYSTNIWVFNPVYKYRFIDFQNYWLQADSMWPRQIPGEYVLMRVTVHIDYRRTSLAQKTVSVSGPKAMEFDPDEYQKMKYHRYFQKSYVPTPPKVPIPTIWLLWLTLLYFFNQNLNFIN